MWPPSRTLCLKENLPDSYSYNFISLMFLAIISLLHSNLQKSAYELFNELANISYLGLLLTK